MLAVSGILSVSLSLSSSLTLSLSLYLCSLLIIEGLLSWAFRICMVNCYRGLCSLSAVLLIIFDVKTHIHTHTHTPFPLIDSDTGWTEWKAKHRDFCSIDWHALHRKDFPRLRYRKCDRVQSLWAVYWKRESKVSNISSVSTSAELIYLHRYLCRILLFSFVV